jgi:hypothetical protein
MTSRLYSLRESVVLDVGPDLKKNLSPTLLRESASASSRYTLMPRIEAIHERMTKNFVYYGAEFLRGDPNFTKEGQLLPTGVYSWTSPHPKPILRNHDEHGEPLGRVRLAEFVMHSSTGKPAIIVVPAISDPECIEKVKDGRYLTVSVGANTDGAYCSICGTNRAEGFCEHRRGQEYKEGLAFIKVKNLWFFELSFVNMPADDAAMVVDVGEMQMMEMLLVDRQRGEVTDLGRSTTHQMDAYPDLFCEGAREVATIVFPEGGTILSKKNQPPVEESKIGTQLESAPEPASTGETVTSVAPVAEEAQPSDDQTSKEPNNDAGVEQRLDELFRRFAELQTSLQSMAQNPTSDVESAAETEDSAPPETGTPSLEEKVSDLEAELQTLRTEREQFLSQITEQRKEIRGMLIDQTLELRIEMGRATESDLESERQALEERSDESLRDGIADLRKERKSPAQRVPQTVENPAINRAKESTDPPVEGDKAIAAEPSFEAKDMLRALLEGRAIEVARAIRDRK